MIDSLLVLQNVHGPVLKARRAFSRHPLNRLSDFEGKRVGPLSVSSKVASLGNKA